MKSQNHELAALVRNYEETQDSKIVLDIAVKLREMQGAGDPILTQRALLIIDEEINKAG